MLGGLPRKGPSTRRGAAFPVPQPLQDIRLMNDHAMKAAPRKTGAIILGGGEQRPLAPAPPGGRSSRYRQPPSRRLLRRASLRASLQRF